MSDNLFIKIITLADLDKALNDTLTYVKIKHALFMLLKGEKLGGELAQLVEDKALNQALCKLLKIAYNTLLKDVESDALKRTLNKIKDDEDLYNDLYEDLDDKQLVAKLRVATHDNELSDAFDTALCNARHALLSRVEKDKVKLCKTLQTEALQRGNINYYLEVLKVLSWLSDNYGKSSDDAKIFIKKHIDTIAESDHPQKTLERLQLFHLAQLRELNIYQFKKFLDTSLEHLQAFEQLLGNFSSKDPSHLRIENMVMDSLNKKTLHAFIENPTLQPLKIIKDEPFKPINFNFFTLLSILWEALVKRNNNSQGLIDRIDTAFKEIKNKNKEYKTYREELLKLTNKYQAIYNASLNRFAKIILDENGEVKNDINLMVLAKDLCAISHLYHFGITIAKKNPIVDKFFEKFSDPNKVNDVIKGQLEVLSWIYQGFYGNMNNDGKAFIEQHLDQIMNCHRPKEALNVLFFIFFYKLHNKTNTNEIIEAVLKKHSPEEFFKEFMKKLVSLNEHPNLLKEDEISSVLDALLVKSLQNCTSGVSEMKTKILSQNRPITAWCSFYECQGHRSLDVNIEKTDIRLKY